MTFTGPLCFTVHGEAVPKQSFRAVRKEERAADGTLQQRVRSYQTPRVKAWAEAVAWEARQAMRGEPPLIGALRVRLEFYLPHKRRVDCDNLSKGVLDPLTAAGVWEDDKQVVDLHIVKCVVPRNQGRVVILIDVC